MAHPDDIEITCAGTLILLARAGWRRPPGHDDRGRSRLDATRSRAAISRIRRQEAAASARAPRRRLHLPRLHRSHHRVHERRRSAASRRCFASVRPISLITPPARGLHGRPRGDVAHRARSRLRIDHPQLEGRTGESNRATASAAAPATRCPVILYADPIDLTDHAGPPRPAHATWWTSPAVIEVKEQMLAAHDSQRSWLRDQHGEDEYLLWMRRMGADRARDCPSPIGEVRRRIRPAPRTRISAPRSADGRRSARGLVTEDRGSPVTACLVPLFARALHRLPRPGCLRACARDSPRRHRTACEPGLPHRGDRDAARVLQPLRRGHRVRASRGRETRDAGAC